MLPRVLRSRRVRVALVAVVLVVVVIGGGLAALVARDDLEGTRDDLTAARADRRATRHELARTRTDEEETTFARDLLRAQLREVERQIGGTRGDLSSTRRKSASRYVRVPLLTECLNGVASVLNAASVGDDRGALLALLAIEPTCARAQGRAP